MKRSLSTLSDTTRGFLKYRASLREKTVQTTAVDASTDTSENDSTNSQPRSIAIPARSLPVSSQPKNQNTVKPQVQPAPKPAPVKAPRPKTQIQERATPLTRSHPVPARTFVPTTQDDKHAEPVTAKDRFYASSADKMGELPEKESLELVLSRISLAENSRHAEGQMANGNPLYKSSPKPVWCSTSHNGAPCPFPLTRAELRQNFTRCVFHNGLVSLSGISIKELEVTPEFKKSVTDRLAALKSPLPAPK